MGLVTPHPETEIEINSHVNEKRAGAFFFMPKPESRSLAQMAATSGMVDGAVHHLADEPGAEVFTGFWGGLFGIARRREYPDYVALEIFFSVMGFIRLYDGHPGRRADLPLERDPALPVAHAFRESCLRLGAEVGLLTLSNIISATRFLAEDIYPKVHRWDGRALADVAGLLYVNDEYRYNTFDMPDLVERDQLPVEQGMLIFSQRGRKRWN